MRYRKLCCCFREANALAEAASELESAGVEYDLVQATLEQTATGSDTATAAQVAAALIDEPYVDDVTGALDDEDFTLPARQSPRSFRCRECNRVFKKAAQLKQHMKIHTG